jgi:ribose 5-phosphate isomerase B
MYPATIKLQLDRECKERRRATGGGIAMRVAIGCDEAAFELKEVLRRHLADAGHDVHDFGVHDTRPAAYPDVAFAVAEAIAAGRHDRGVLVCGTGIGMAICANKVRGIRAAQAHDTYSAGRASMSNDAQIVTLGARVVGPELAKSVVDTFLAATFQGGRSAPKVELIARYERGKHD